MFKTGIIIFAMLFAGCSSINKENLNPYEGLLAQNTTPPPSLTPLRTSELKNKYVVIVASNSFEAHVKGYVDYYEGGSGDRYRNFLVGLTTVVNTVNPLAGQMTTALGASNPEGLYASMRRAQDPRVVVEQVSGVLVRAFGKVGVAADFAEAQEQKADYIVLMDYWWAPNVMGTAFTGAASVHLLDGNLNRFFAAEARTTAARPGVSAVAAFEKIHTEVSQNLVADLRRRLAVAP